MKHLSTRTPLILALACNISLFTAGVLHAETPKGKKPAAEVPAKEEEEAEEKELTVEDYKKVSMAIAVNMEKAATILETVKDAASAKTASTLLAKTTKDLKAIVAKMEEMGEPTPELEKEVNADEDFKAKGTAAGAHFQAAINTFIAADPEAVAAVKPAFEEYGKTLQSLSSGGGAKAEVSAPVAKVMEISEALLDNMDGAADILETVEDAKTAKQAAKDLTAAGKELKALIAELKGLEALSPEDEKALSADTSLSKKGDEVGKHFTEAANALAAMDDKDVVKLVEPALTAYGKIASTIPGATGTK